MPEQESIVVPGDSDAQKGKRLQVKLCYRAEKPMKDGRIDPVHRDLIQLLSGAKVVSELETEMPITVGRMDGLKLERSDRPFVAVSIGAGEFCNAIAIFDAGGKARPYYKKCLKNYVCKVTDLSAARCRAEIVCEDSGGDSPNEKRAPKLSTEVSICNNP